MREVSSQQAVQMLKKDDVVLVDVREPAEHAGSHIPDALLRPLSRLTDCSFPEQTREVIVHCQRGVRSQKAILTLQEQFTSLRFYNLDGGIDSWQQAGYGTASNPSSAMPLDRQSAITTGVLVLFSLGLGLVHTPWWFSITAALGVGLLYTGLTGLQWLNLVLARMPWNRV